jgi:hypothetical protein
MVRERQKNWTATAITVPTLYGLKVSAERHNRSIGQELEEILVKQAKIKRLSKREYDAIISRIEQGKA